MIAFYHPIAWDDRLRHINIDVNHHKSILLSQFSSLIPTYKTEGFNNAIINSKAKKYLILTFNKNDECSDLLLELNNKLYNCEYSLDNIDYNLKNLPIEKSFLNSVTKVISNLTGKDYIELKKLKIFDNIKFVKEKSYIGTIYPDWVIRNDYYSEFGCFLEYSPFPTCQQGAEPRPWGGKGGDKSPPRDWEAKYL